MTSKALPAPTWTQWRWSGVDAAGRKVAGTRRAHDKASLLAELHASGLRLVLVEGIA